MYISDTLRVLLLALTVIKMVGWCTGWMRLQTKQPSVSRNA